MYPISCAVQLTAFAAACCHPASSHPAGTPAPGPHPQDHIPTERWAAYIEPATGYGIGVFTPIATGLTSYRVGKDASTRASDVSYLAMTATFDIPRNASRGYKTYVAVGRVDEIRET